MKKKIVLFPLIGFLLVSCGGGTNTDVKNTGNTTQETGQNDKENQEMTEKEKAERVATKKEAAKSKLDELVNPLINKISNQEIKQLVQSFYNSEKDYIESIIDLPVAEAALEKVASDFVTFTIQTLRPEVVSKLNSLINPIISQITVDELKQSVQTFYDREISKLNAVTSASDIVDYLTNLVGDVDAFVSSETGRLLIEFKNQALDKVNELLLPLIQQIENEDLKSCVEMFAANEKETIRAIDNLEDAKKAVTLIAGDISSFAIQTFKPRLISKLNSIVNPLINKIEYKELKESVQKFYNTQISSLESVNSLSDLIHAFSTIKSDFEQFVVTETERILTALKNKAIEELDPYVTTLIEKIPYDEIKDDVNKFYLNQKAVLLAVSTFDEVPTIVEQIKKDVFDFVLEETQKVAVAKLKEVVDAGLKKIPNKDLQKDLSDFADIEYAKLMAVTKIEDVPSVLTTVMEETAAHIKSLLASTVKDYIDKLTQIERATAYDYLPEAMCPTYANNLVNASDIAYNFENFTNVSDINQKGFGEQWQMVVDNINQSTKLAKVFNVAETALSAATNAIKIFIDNSYAEEMHKEFLNESKGFAADFSYKDLILSAEIRLTNEHEIPLAGTVKPIIKMKYDLLKDEKDMFISLGDVYKFRYIISDNKYEMATTYGVTIGEKSGSRASYLGIDINNGVTCGHIYEYTSFGELNPISAAADFRIEDGYVSVIGNKASGLVGSEAIINELYNANTGRLLGYMVEETLHEDYKLIEFDVTYHTFWFNIFDIVKIDNVKAVANGNIDPHKNNHDVYLNDSKNIFEPQKNSVKVLVEVKTSRKFDVEMRNHYYYGLDNDGNLVKYETQIPMLFVQDDDIYHTDKFSNTNFTDFVGDMEKSGITGTSISVANSIISKIRTDSIELVRDFKANEKTISAEVIKSYLGLLEE